MVYKLQPRGHIQPEVWPQITLEEYKILNEISSVLKRTAFDYYEAVLSKLIFDNQKKFKIFGIILSINKNIVLRKLVVAAIFIISSAQGVCLKTGNNHIYTQNILSLLPTHKTLLAQIRSQLRKYWTPIVS